MHLACAVSSRTVGIFQSPFLIIGVLLRTGLGRLRAQRRVGRRGIESPSWQNKVDDIVVER